jgi:hypothetical protein
MPVFKTKESYWKIRRRKGFLIETFCSVLSLPCSLLRACHLRQLVLLPRREPLSPLLRDSSLRHLVLLLRDPVLLKGDQPAGPTSGQPSHQQGLLRLSVDAWLQLGIRMGSVQLSIQVKNLLQLHCGFTDTVRYRICSVLFYIAGAYLTQAIVKYLNFLFSDSSADSSSSDSNPEEDPVLLRRKRFVRRKDRAVHSLASSMDPSNYDPVPPPAIDST